MRLPLTARLGVFWGAFMATTGNVGAANFDDASAVSRVEQAVSATDRASKLDNSLAVAHSAPLTKAVDPVQLKASPRAWSVDRRNACPDDVCLVAAYQQREAVLGLSPEPIRESVPHIAQAAPSSVELTLATEGYQMLIDDAKGIKFWFKRAPALDKGPWKYTYSRQATAGTVTNADPVLFHCGEFKVGLMVGARESDIKSSPIHPGSGLEKVLRWACNPTSASSAWQPAKQSAAPTASPPLAGTKGQGPSLDRQWVKVMPYPSEIDYRHYIAPGTLTVAGSLRRIWTLQDRDYSRRGESMSTATLTEYNCERVESRVLKIVNFSGNMGSGNSQPGSSGPSGSWNSDMQGGSSTARPSVVPKAVCDLPVPADGRGKDSESPPAQVFVPELRRVDCQNASVNDDFMLCDHRSLMELDRQLSALVFEKAKASPDPYGIAADYGFWLYEGAYRRNTGLQGRAESRCRTPACLAKLYQERIKALQGK